MIDQSESIGENGAPTPCPECGQTTGHYDDCPVGLGVIPAEKTAE